MKKFLVITLAAALCLALALPAMAKVTAGGRVDLDWSYLSQNTERASTWSSPFGIPAFGVPQGSTATTNGFDNMNFVTPSTLNRLNLVYTSDDGAIKGMVEVRGGGGLESTTTGFIYAWIQWQITPNNSITFGRQTTNFARFIPNQWVGTHETTILGVGFGNVNHTTARTGVKGYHKFSDMIGLVWGLYDPHVEGPNKGLIQGAADYSFSTTTGTIVGPTGASAFNLPGKVPGQKVSADNTFPRIDVALPIRFPWGVIEPSATYSQMNFENVAAGSDDSFDIYGLSIGGRLNFGMIYFGGEFTIGQNLGGGSYRGAEGGPPVTYVSGTTVKIADTDVTAWFADVGFKFGPNKINFMYGQISYENEADPAIPKGTDVRELDYSNSFYGISWLIGVAKGFTINPELMFYNFGDSEYMGALGHNSCDRLDMGTEMLIGVQFMLVF